MASIHMGHSHFLKTKGTTSHAVLGFQGLCLAMPRFLHQAPGEDLGRAKEEKLMA